MRIVVYDIEVFKYDWIVVFYDTTSHEWSVFHNDNNGVRTYLSAPDRIFCGFNNKGYDNHVVKAMACGATPELVKEINDFIIDEDRNGWEHWFLRQKRFWFDSFDLMDDTRDGTSLKHIEAHLGWNIEETQVDFNIDRPLTLDEIESTIFYCKWDVRATAKLLTLRKNYLECKIQLGRMCGLSDAKALYMTNARLTAAYLGAKAVQRDDGREYEYPSNMRTEIIPKPILDFFELLKDESIPDKVLFKRKLEGYDLGGCPCNYAWGGVHGSLSKYSELSTSTRAVQNRDVSSLYPSLLIKYNYISRNCSDPKKYENTYYKRLDAKHRGDKKTANTLKNPLNTTSGAQDQSTNPLYDPKNARGMRISGQLFLTELCVELINTISSFKLLNLNTDGLMYSVNTEDLPTVDAICSAWEARVSFELETDRISRVYIKDVNNLLFVDEDGHVKTVGGYLNYGIAEKGGWSINNNHVIVKKAVIDYFVNGTPVEDTIYRCTDIHEFQIIAKAGGGYDSCYRVPPNFDEIKEKWKKEHRYRVVNAKGKEVWKYPSMKWHDYTGLRVAVQKVNRVYASKNPNMGTIVKVKADGTVGKIGGLPDSCIIDNKNTLTLDSVDREWYVALARKYVEDYTGESRNKENA